jgi:FMN-binding domain
MRRTVRALSTFAVLALPLVNLTARAASATLTAAKKTTVWKKVAGPQAQADRWGYVEVTLVVKKTTTTTGSGKNATTKVTRKITGAPVPVYPDHTGRSVFISQNAIPILIGEVLHAQLNPHIDLVSGATYTSEAFIQSLQAAIIKAKKV